MIRLSVITLILALNFPSRDVSGHKNLNIVLVDCQSRGTVSYDGDYVTFAYPQYSLRKKVKANDRSEISRLSKVLLSNKSDEIIDNACVNDGFHFQVILTTKNIRKRIFIGNSYDERVNPLVGILNAYVDPENEFFQLNGIIFISNEERKQELIEHKAECDVKTVNKWYNDWCDVNK
jgi:hypothetical protein